MADEMIDELLIRDETANVLNKVIDEVVRQDSKLLVPYSAPKGFLGLSLLALASVATALVPQFFDARG